MWRRGYVGAAVPGHWEGTARLRLGQSSLLLLPLTGRVLEPWNGVWGRDHLLVTPLGQLPITPPCWFPFTSLCQLWEEGAGSSQQQWQPWDQ